MARSSYVYVIQNSHDRPIAAFTVKYEAVAYINRDLYQGMGWYILRFRDGKREEPVAIGVTDFCK